MILEVVMAMALVLGVLYVMNESKKERKANKALQDKDNSNSLENENNDNS
jgi:hypothetical protein